MIKLDPYSLLTLCYVVDTSLIHWYYFCIVVDDDDNDDNNEMSEGRKN